MYEFYPYFTNDGTVGLFSPTDDDIYHSTYGALSESWQKFILPAKLKDYIKSHNQIKILDICYGIGYNTKAALNVFIENYLENEKINRKFKKNIKKTNPDMTNIETIHADNKFKKEFTENSQNLEKIKHDQNISICERYSDNILSFENQNCSEKNESYDFNSHESIEHSNDTKYLNSTIVKEVQNNKKIYVDAVDTDSVLVYLSPFITRGKSFIELILKNKSKLKNEKEISNEKFNQVKTLNKKRINILSKKFKLRKEVQFLLYETLVAKSHEFIKDENLKNILTQDVYSDFLDEYMLNLAGFNKKNRLYLFPMYKITAFLHNIYYRYVSRSYKRAQNLLKNESISLNFNCIDARKHILETTTKYNYIFLDAFTPAKCPALWSLQFFETLYSKLEEDGMILTYSSSAAVRNAFLKAGFYVGKTFDNDSNKFVGTVAVKNLDLIEFPLDEKDLDLINSKAGICFQDKNLDLDNNSIIINREREVQLSNLPSSSKVLKRYKNVKNESL